MIKTKKSFTKRLKVAKSGKILARRAGQNHFNAKERSRTSTNKRTMRVINISNKIRSRFLATI